MDANLVSQSFKSVEAVKYVVSVLSNNVIIWAAITACAGIPVFVPCMFPDDVRLYHWAAVLVLIFSSVYWGGLVWLAWRPYRAKIWHLRHIGADERCILQKYFKEGRSCVEWNAFNGAVACLIGKGILYNATKGPFPFYAMPVAIDPYIFQELRGEPGLIGCAKSEYGADGLTEAVQPEKPGWPYSFGDYNEKK